MKKVKRMVCYENVLIVMLTGLLVLFSVGSVVKADDFPNKPINLIIHMSPGGPTDQMVRMLTPTMEKVLNTPIVIQYKLGGGGTIAYLAVSKEKPDGYTVGSYAASFFTQQYVKTGGAKMATLDFAGNFAEVDNCLAVLSTSPFKNLVELLDFSKKNPGMVTIANSGTGASMHLPAAAIEKEAGVKFTHVPTNGESAALMAMLGGHVTAASLSIGGLTEYFKAGKVRALTINTEKRVPDFPDVPTSKEQGINFVYQNPVGLFGPKGIPENRLKILSDAVAAGFKSEQFQKFMKTVGYRPVNLDYKQTAEMARAYDAKIRDLCKLVGLYQE
jgi:tripartite-type tricarboxylate transporter receptor subunit TctC